MSGLTDMTTNIGFGFGSNVVLYNMELKFTDLIYDEYCDVIEMLLEWGFLHEGDYIFNRGRI